MDLEDTRNAVAIAGLPEELVKRIWKKKSDTGLMADYLNWKKGQENGTKNR